LGEILREVEHPEPTVLEGPDVKGPDEKHFVRHRRKEEKWFGHVLLGHRVLSKETNTGS
jgi:hypothetical protein